MMVLLTRTILINAVLLSSAYSQPASSPLGGSQMAPTFEQAPVLVPLPPNGCVWAGRPFSDGAGFCVADKVLQTCTIGRWARENSEGCRGALVDSR